VLEEGSLPGRDGAGKVVLEDGRGEHVEEDAVTREWCADGDDGVEGEDLAAAEAGSVEAGEERIESGDEEEDGEGGHAGDASGEVVGGVEEDLAVEGGGAEGRDEAEREEYDAGTYADSLLVLMGRVGHARVPGIVPRRAIGCRGRSPLRATSSVYGP